MAPKRTLERHSFFDAPALLAFLEDGLGPGKRDTAERHCRTIQAAAVAAADRGQKSVDLSVAAVPNLPAFARERLPGVRAPHLLGGLGGHLRRRRHR